MADASLKDLGKKLFLDSGTLTPVLKSLETKGYVKRYRSKEDERVLLVEITKAGDNLKEKAGKVEKENALLAIDELRKIIKAQPYDYDTRKKLIDLYFQQKMYLPAVRECMVMVEV